jgi:hypothetical protein
MELGRRVALGGPVAMLVLVAAMQPAGPTRVVVDPVPAVAPCRGAPALPHVPAASAGVAWYRLDLVLDGEGTLAGQRLVAGVGSAATLTLELPAESFATGPVGGTILVGDDDGARSRLRRLDVARRCWTEVALEPAVIRSAVTAPDGMVTWEHRVDRRTRADLGVWGRPASGPRGVGATRVLEGLVPTAADGPTFVTDLAVAADGRLVVAACGERTCLTRVLDPRTRAVARAVGTGPALGVSGTTLVTMAACSSLPCPVERRDLVDGTTARLADGDARGVLGGPGDGFVVVPVARSIAVTAVAGIAGGILALDLHPVVRGSTATSGADVPPGAVVLAPQGRIGDPSSAWRLDPQTRAVSRLVEVNP